MLLEGECTMGKLTNFILEADDMSKEDIQLLESIILEKDSTWKKVKQSRAVGKVRVALKWYKTPAIKADARQIEATKKEIIKLKSTKAKLQKELKSSPPDQKKRTKSAIASINKKLRGEKANKLKRYFVKFARTAWKNKGKTGAITAASGAASYYAYKKLSGAKKAA